MTSQSPSHRLCRGWVVYKKWRTYGTWKSSCFVNEYYFGSELATLIMEDCSGEVTHDEECIFSIADFSENIENSIYEKYW
jgi:hypothetical protein